MSVCPTTPRWCINRPITTFEEAASVPFGATTALYFLRDVAKLHAGQKILVIGASGGVGVFAVQLAKYYGAEVTGVCSTANLELVKSLGADKVIDYTTEDFTQNGDTYDVIFDIVPGRASFSHDKVALKPNGLYLAGAGGLKAFAQMAWTALIGGKKVVAGMAPDRKEDLVFLKELIEAGKIKPVIDRRYPLEQTAEAHRYVDHRAQKGQCRHHDRGIGVSTQMLDTRIILSASVGCADADLSAGRCAAHLQRRCRQDGGHAAIYASHVAGDRRLDGNPDSDGCTVPGVAISR